MSKLFKMIITDPNNVDVYYKGNLITSFLNKESAAMYINTAIKYLTRGK